MDERNLRYVVENNAISGKRVTGVGLQNSTFLRSVHEHRYKIYDNDLESVWFV